MLSVTIAVRRGRGGDVGITLEPDSRGNPQCRFHPTLVLLGFCPRLPLLYNRPFHFCHHSDVWRVGFAPMLVRNLAPKISLGRYLRVSLRSCLYNGGADLRAL